MSAVLVPATLMADTQTGPLEAFIGSGLGAKHDKAPAEVEQFGRLVGVWDVTAEMRTQSGAWAQSAPGVWAWKYAIGGFAVQDLWYQSADNLPAYMAHLGRDYLLTTNRLYDVAGKKWQVAWMANGAGKVMGADFGTFTAKLEAGDIIMNSQRNGTAFGLQRVTFYEISADSFKWKSEYSMDEGKSWNRNRRNNDPFLPPACP